MDCKNIMHKKYMGETLKTFEIFKRGKKNQGRQNQKEGNYFYK